MDDFVTVAGVDDLESGELKKVVHEGKVLLLARVGDNYYCADNRCPHLGGDLSQGDLEGTIIKCPVHKSQFDLKDGKVIRWTNWSGIKLALSKIFRPPREMKTYPLKIEDGKIMVQI